MKKKKIKVVFTGGTICMKIETEDSGAVPALNGKEIISMIPLLDQIAEVSIYDFGKYPGPHINPDIMFDLSNIIIDFTNDENVDGIVITHGTDTLEETAYFLDLAINSPKPIVVVGAMMNSSELNWDGPANLRDAVTIAASDNFRNTGVLVCLNGKVNAASEVTKTNTDEPDTFQSLNFGYLGTISHGEALLFRKPRYRAYIPVKKIESKIALIKCYAGMEDDIFRYLVDSGYKGIVVEGMGIGNVPPKTFDGIKYAIDKGLPVVLVSRCPIGKAIDIYGYYGAGKWLKKIGVIYADFLNGQKARIKLMLALSYTNDLNTIREIFEKGKLSIFENI